MRLQEHMVGVVQRAQEEAFRFARAFPPERLDWQPLEKGQSVMSMARELAKTPDWAYWVLTGAQPEEPENAADDQAAEMASWRTLDECDGACRAKLERLFALYRAMPDARLAETKWLPFNGGRDHTYAELLDYPRWNFVYHLGQMAYIKGLLEALR